MPLDVLGFDHIDLTVGDLERSTRFYARVLEELGFRRVDDPSGDVVFANALVGIALHPTRHATPSPFDRYRVGLHHLAFRAARRDDVDTFHEFLVREGVTVLDAPAHYPHYGPNYYAVFFADPDGMKLELVHQPWGYFRRAMTDGRDPRPRYPRTQDRTA